MEDSTDSGVNEEWIQGLGLEGGTSERTTMRVGLSVKTPNCYSAGFRVESEAVSILS